MIKRPNILHRIKRSFGVRAKISEIQSCIDSCKYYYPSIAFAFREEEKDYELDVLKYFSKVYGRNLKYESCEGMDEKIYHIQLKYDPSLVGYESVF